MSQDGLIYKSRLLLIKLGKIIPFAICAVLFISYTETAFSLLSNNFVEYDGYVIPYKPISWFISGYFEYNLQTLVVVTLVSVAIRTCKWNKFACLYLAINLYEKYLFSFVVLDTKYYYIVIAINIVVSLFFILMGFRILLNKH